MAQALQPLRATLRRAPLHVVLLGLCALWLVPTVGLLISSFRPPRLVPVSGWWTALVPPYQITLQNYRQVLDAYSMGRSFLNSLFITIPATIIPVIVAAYAAYAFAWITLEIRHVFHGEVQLFVLSTEAEWYAYSLAWLAFASAGLAIGLVWRNRWLRQAGLVDADHAESENSRKHLHCLADRILERNAFAISCGAEMLLDKMRDDFRVSFRGKLVAFFDELLLQ